MILVPMDTPGVKVLRPIPVFGFYGVPDRASEVVVRECAGVRQQYAARRGSRL
jgi:hypothetical protein